MADVVFEQAHGDLLQAVGRGGDLGEDVDAVLILLHHPLEPPYLTFDAAEARQDILFIVV